MPYARIIGTGSYVPERVLTNDDLSRMLGENINDFVSKIVGINERHICADNESTADLATAASRRALEAANVAPEDLDLIILATDTPEYLSPATSVVVQQRLGAKNAGTFDVNCACAGFVTALDTATKYIVADAAYRNVLVVGAYAMSKFLDWTEKKTATIFADGAGAVVVQASDESPGFLGSKLVADGRYHDHMGVYAGGTFMPIDERVLAEGFYTKVRFTKKYPPEVNIEGWQRIVRDVLDKCELTIDDVALFLFTQVNLSTIKIVMEALGLPMSRTHTVMGKWGYTGSACIPMVLDDAVRAGKLERGQVVVMCASGGGLNMACAAFRW
ncbi:MAG: ketoacyl-ACP synthase III [Pyrinomonadaceae bacterium]|nr:ketoacyl-ACP synthase III [Pyrinomonadaceae bacterium]